MDKITIVGLGFVGSSIGYKLRLARRRQNRIVGFDADSKVQQKAGKTGAIDKSEWSLPAAVSDADLVVLAVPSLALEELFEEIAPHLKPGATVTDTSSSKREVIRWANELLPRSVGFVSGNPLVQGSGIEEARGDAFEGAEWALAPTPHAPQESVRAVVQLVERMGAKPFFVGADEHDSYIAAVSHLPAVLSNALMLGVARSPSWREMGRFASGDFRDHSKLAGVDPSVSLGSIVSNSDMVVHWIDQVMQELADLRVMLEDESRSEPDGPLAMTLNDAWEARLRWESGISPVEIERPRLPSSSESIMALFVGHRVAERMRSMGQSSDDRPGIRGRK